MRRRVRGLSVALIAITFFPADGGKLVAQVVPGQIDVEFAVLSPPHYPPLARTARVSGDVKLELQLRPDGTVSSARVISGHPLLAPAAVESAKASRFACFQCAIPATYILTYTFGLRNDSDCNIVTPRAPKCLYLWKCGRTQYGNRTHPPIIIRSSDHIALGVDAVCMETEYATSSRKR